MFFNKKYKHIINIINGIYKKIFFILMIVPFLTACDYFFKARNNTQKVQKFEVQSKDATQCFSKTLPAFKLYFLGKDKSQEATKFIDCIESTVHLFEENIASQNANVFSRAGIIKLIEKFFFKKKINQKIVDRVSEVKVLLFGGSNTEISKEEITVFIDFLHKLKQSLINLRQYVTIFRITTKQPLDQKTFQENREAFEVLEREAESWGQWLDKKNNLKLSLAELINIINDLGYTEIQSLINYLPVMEAAKAVFIKPPEKEIIQKEWTVVLTAIVKIYSFSHHFDVFLKEENKEYKKDFDVQKSSFFTSKSSFATFLVEFAEISSHSTKLEGLNLAILRYEFDILFKILKNSIDQHQNHIIPADELKALLTAASKFNFMPKKLATPTTIMALIPALFDKIFSSNHDYKIGSVFAGISENHLKGLKEFVELWFWGQETISKIFQNEKTIDAQFIIKELDSINKNIDLNKNQKAMMFRLIDLIRRGRPLVWKDKKTIITRRDPNYLYSSGDMYALNAINIWVSYFYAAYISDKKRSISQGITKAELQCIYEDFRNFGSDLGIMDPRNYASGSRSFIEGSLFTSVSGDFGNSVLLDFHSAVEFLTFVLSADFMANKMHEDISKNCNYAHDFPVYDFNKQLKLPKICFQKYVMDISERKQTLYKSIPRVSNLFEKFNSNKTIWDMYFKILDSAYLNDVLSTDNIELSELKTFATILQYIEGLLARYDVNDDGVLNPSEFWKIYPVFKATIASIKGNEFSFDNDLTWKEYIINKFEQLKKTEFFEKTQFRAIIKKDMPKDFESLEMMLNLTKEAGSTIYWEYGIASFLEKYFSKKDSEYEVTHIDILKIMGGIKMLTRLKKWKETVAFISKNAVELKQQMLEGKGPLLYKIGELMQCNSAYFGHLNSFFKMVTEGGIWDGSAVNNISVNPEEEASARDAHIPPANLDNEKNTFNFETFLKKLVFEARKDPALLSGCIIISK